MLAIPEKSVFVSASLLKALLHSDGTAFVQKHRLLIFTASI